MEFDAIIDTPIGKVGIQLSGGNLIALQFLSSKIRTVDPTNSVAKKIISQLKRYFSNAKNNFDLDYELRGTDLQQKIWYALRKIPTGKTIAYGELAQKIGTSPRVIGNACRRNPIPIIIPCHRVVASDGNLRGYCGQTKGDALSAKAWLLQHEML